MGRQLVSVAVAAIVIAAPASAPAQVKAQVTAVEELDASTRAFASFDARDLAGRRWRAADLAGRVVLLDFWATWCAPCLADVPYLRRARERFPENQFTIIGVSLDTADRRTLAAWLNRQRVDWPQIWDDRGFDGPLARQFRVESLPRSVLFDPRGRAVATDIRGERLLPLLQKLLQPAK
jgi:thiol-disulfide isomerase/thioredoxin